jgi:hypothetical protein
MDWLLHWLKWSISRGKVNTETCYVDEILIYKSMTMGSCPSCSFDSLNDTKALFSASRPGYTTCCSLHGYKWQPSVRDYCIFTNITFLTLSDACSFCTTYRGSHVTRYPPNSMRRLFRVVVNLPLVSWHVVMAGSAFGGLSVFQALTHRPTNVWYLDK